MTLPILSGSRKAAFLFFIGIVSSATAGPKYGPNAQPLSKKTNLEYFQKNPAPDFWALIPHYRGQPTAKACGATNLTLITNAAREAFGNLSSDDKLLSVEDYVKKYTDKAYEETILGSKFDRTNVTNKNMARLIAQGFEKLKLSTAATKAEVHDIDLKDLPGSKKKFVEALKENEKSADDFIFFSFIQGKLTGDPEGGAHVATIAGFDAKKNLVLIMDPDREWYEPYWSPVDAVFDSISDPKSDGLHPGWIHVRLR